MKAALVVLLISAVNTFCFSQGYNDIYSPSPLMVYAVGNSGNILRSTNAGGSYSASIAGSQDLNAVFGLGSRVWAAGNFGAYLKSTNNGVSWDIQSIGGGVRLNSVFFTDSLTGFIAGANGTILKSVDAGSSWVTQTSGVTVELYKIKFTGPDTGYACGENAVFLKTVNGGANWNVVTIPIAGPVTAFDCRAGLIIAGSKEGAILRSTNSGVSWSRIDLCIISKPGITDVVINTAELFTLSLESGSIWQSADTGRTFTYSRSPFLDEVSAIAFNTGRGFAVSRKQQVIMRSLDLGINWAFLPGTSFSMSFTLVLPYFGSTYNKVLDMNYQKRGVIYILQSSRLMKSYNSGLNWEFVCSFPNNFARQFMVSMADSSKMIAIFDDGSDNSLLYRTTNHGANWVQSYIAPGDYIGNMITQDPQSPDTLYMGVRDSVMRSTNFGLNWTKLADNGFDDWCDIAVKPDNHNVIYAATNHYPAKLHRSTNGGFNWTVVDIIFDTTFSEMPAIATTNHRPDIVFHVQLGTNGQTGLKRSYSQGSSWLFNQMQGATWSVDFAKDDPNLFAAGSVGNDPVILTTNGGINFIGTPDIWAEQILFYDRSNLFAVNHGEVFKLKVTYTSPIGIQNISSELPLKFKVNQNYPNPFNPATKIRFEIPASNKVKVTVFDILGREVETLLNSQLNPGIYEVDWNASDFSSGVYFYRITTGEYSETMKMVLLK